MGHCFYQSWLQLPYHLFKNCLVTSSFRENGCSVLNWCKGIECKLELSRTERIWATACRRGNNPRSMLSKVPSHNWFCGRDLYFSCCLIQFSQWPGRLVSFLQRKNLRLEATKYLSKVTQEGMEWELKALFLWSHSLHFVYQVSSLNPNFVIYKNESKNILCITADSYASTRKGQPTHGEDSVSLILSAGQSWIRAFGTKMAGTQKCCCLQLSTSYVHLVWSV